jgi:hypothetical protein
MRDVQTAKKDDFMKPASKKSAKKDEAQPHYDFSNGVRGKHYKKYREGVTVRLLEKSTEGRFVELDDEMSKIFPDSRSVNNALRHLVDAMPHSKRKRSS